ncbi:MAG: hypothetical protein VSS75_002460 [Candidatus Parabeggiatoa sp.]|nr:hypothetical protein [Candidatus Parabeggiatoa sp.]
MFLFRRDASRFLVETRCLASLFRGDASLETRSIASKQWKWLLLARDAKHRVETMEMATLERRFNKINGL